MSMNVKIKFIAGISYKNWVLFYRLRNKDGWCENSSIDIKNAQEIRDFILVTDQ